MSSLKVDIGSGEANFMECLQIKDREREREPTKARFRKWNQLLQVEKGRFPLNRRETTSSENGKKKNITKKNTIENMWLSERALYLRELIPYCFILFASEYKESEEREDKNNKEEILENMLAKNGLEDTHWMEIIQLQQCQSLLYNSSISTQHH